MLTILGFIGSLQKKKKKTDQDEEVTLTAIQKYNAHIYVDASV